MLRTLVRGLGTLGTLWTLAVLGAPTMLHPCAAHDPGASHAAHSRPDAQPIAHPIAHAMHHAAPSPAMAATVDESAPAVPPGCTCVDCGCATSPVAFAIRATMRVREVLQPGHVGWWSTSASAPPRALAHRQPFANGPPGAAA